MRRWSIILFLVFILSACRAEPELIITTNNEDPPTSTPIPITATPEPFTFTEQDCTFTLPLETLCGVLTVPQNRSNPASGSIQLPVIVFKSTNPNPQSDPVIHLAGGPGANLLASVSFYLDNGGFDILEERDYILFNQRGTGFTTYDLTCDAYTALRYDLATTSLSDDEKMQQLEQAILDCRDQWEAGGADLSGYTSAENAADIDALRQVLGYEQVNLYGISYGTRLALTAMRDHPQGIRSAILDSVYPPQADLFSDVPSNAHRAFSLVFATCATCEDDLYAGYETLENNPAPVPISNGRTIQVDGSLYLETLFTMFYRTDLLPLIPDIISEVAAGEVNVLARYLPLALDRSGIAVGMYYSIQCSEDVAFDSYEDAQAKSADLPEVFGTHFVDPSDYELCTEWPTADLTAMEDEPVSSAIPALILSGEYDPITPPSWGELAAETLPNSYSFVFEDTGHGVIRSDGCALQVALAFLDDPTERPVVPCIEGTTQTPAP